MVYSVVYRRGFVKRKITEVVADGLIEGHNMRFFIKENGERIEVPTEKTVFWFSRERNEIAKQKEREKFQSLQASVQQARQSERISTDQGGS